MTNWEYMNCEGMVDVYHIELAVVAVIKSINNHTSCSARARNAGYPRPFIGWHAWVLYSLNRRACEVQWAPICLTAGRTSLHVIRKYGI